MATETPITSRVVESVTRTPEMTLVFTKPRRAVTLLAAKHTEANNANATAPNEIGHPF